MVKSLPKLIRTTETAVHKLSIVGKAEVVRTKLQLETFQEEEAASEKELHENGSWRKMI